MENYYDILEIQPDSDQEQILKAYLRAKQSFSPDSMASYSIFDEDESKQLMERIEEAFFVLSNEEKRREYDKVHGFNGFGDSRRDSSIQRIESVTSDPTPEGFAPRTLEEANRIAPEVATASGHLRSSMTANSSNSVGSIGSNPTNFSSPLKDVFFVTRKSLDRAGGTDSQMEEWIANHQEWSGADLKKAREYRNISPEELAEYTKIRKTHILNIESEAFKELPVRVYIRGFLQQLAKALKLPVNEVINGYLARVPETSDVKSAGR